MADAREQILDAATRLMAARGFDGASLSAIAQAVGMRKASLLYHFSSKAALRQGVLERLLGHWSEALPRLLMAATRTGVERFDAVVGELLDFFCDDPDRARLVRRELLDRQQALGGYVDAQIRPWLERVAEQIRVGQRLGTIRAEVDALIYALLVVDLVLGVAASDHLAAAVLGGGDDAAAARARMRAEALRMVRVALFIDAARDDEGAREREGDAQAPRG